jgi:hypothetical protein
MPIRTVPGFPDLQYYLICYDAEGRERSDNLAGSCGVLSTVVVNEVSRTPVSDIFFMSHGWKGDVPAAIEQYDRWTAAMARCTADREAARRRNAAFRTLLVGLHWPSLPFGDERLDARTSFAAPGPATLEELAHLYSTRIASTPEARAAIETILYAAMADVTPKRMPAPVREAYLTLDRESGLGSEGPGAPPGTDREPFDPERAYEASLEDAASFGGFAPPGLLAPMQQLSFYVMKRRAVSFGESGAHHLLRRLQEAAAPKGNPVRVHLMGHSFGCIVVSAVLCGPGGDSAPPRPIETVFLVQGALSLWSYASDIPEAPGRPGYFRALAAGNRVDGPVLITHSRHDYAVGRWYPIAAGVRRQVSFAPGSLPKYGAIGAFGARGPGIQLQDLDMLPESGSYSFRKGVFYNLDSAAYIQKVEGASGAHSDIAHKEVAHAFWQGMRI